MLNKCMTFHFYFIFIFLEERKFFGLFVLGGRGIRGERRLTFILEMVERGGRGDMQGEGLNGIGERVGETILRGDSDGIENESLFVVRDVVVVLEVGEGVPYGGMYAAAAYSVDGVEVFVLEVGEGVPYDGVYAMAAHGVGDVEVFVCCCSCLLGCGTDVWWNVRFKSLTLTSGQHLHLN